MSERKSRQQFYALLLWIASYPAICVSSEAKEPRSAKPAGLDKRIESILSEPRARRGFWGVEVLRLRDGAVLYARNADHLFEPASNMKLFTTAAALEKLGPNFVFRTSVETASDPDEIGRVRDLFLIGRGDPDLGTHVLPYEPKTPKLEDGQAVLEKLAEQVVGRGVHEVQGNLVADDSYFLYEPYGHGWEEEDLEWGYAAPVSALAFDDNALFLHVQPGTNVGDLARVWLDPIPDPYTINNHLETATPPTQEHVFVERAPRSSRLDVWGEIPLGAEENEDSVAIENPPQLIGEIFRRALEGRGVTFGGRVEVRHLTRLEAAALANPFPPPPRRIVLAEHLSSPLREDIKVINKVSQNFHAEMLLRTLARELEGYGSLTVGLEVLREFTAQAGVLPEETYFADGSGLSRQALVTPHAVVKLLEYMARSPQYEAYFDSLPVAGEDGTLANRFASSLARGQIHAKTGTIEHVNALSGYMELPSGEQLAFSILGNSYAMKSQESADTIDRIALAIYTYFRARRKISAKSAL